MCPFPPEYGFQLLDQQLAVLLHREYNHPYQHVQYVALFVHEIFHTDHPGFCSSIDISC